LRLCGADYRTPLHQKLVDYINDRLIASSVALAKWKKACPELFTDAPAAARDRLPGENWIFPDHRTLAEVFEAERNPTRGSLRLIDPFCSVLLEAASPSYA